MWPFKPKPLPLPVSHLTHPREPCSKCGMCECRTCRIVCRAGCLCDGYPWDEDDYDVAEAEQANLKASKEYGW